MVSIIITAYKEPLSIKKALKSIMFSKEVDEIVVVAPDKETLDAAQQEAINEKDNRVIYLQDKGIGKPAALNLALSKSSGDIIIFTDGDVYMDLLSINRLIKYLTNSNWGAVSGMPVPTNSSDNKYGYWAYVLTRAADETREKCKNFHKSIVCSGYLFAIHKNALGEKLIPEDILSDDAFISYVIEKNNYLIGYEPNAKVFVNYPTNFKDWINQKARSTGGYTQLSKMGLSPSKPMRGFWQEVKGLWKVLFSYPKSFKQFYWGILLIFARIWLWIKILWERKIKKKSFSDTWVRIESTK